MAPMEKIADNFLAYIKKQNTANNFGEFEVKHLFQGYALDTISTCAFGIESNALENPDDELLVNGKMVFTSFRMADSYINYFFVFLSHFQFLFNLFSLFPLAFDKIMEITKQIMDSRKDAGIITNDFISKLIDMRNNIEKPNYKGVLTSTSIYPQGGIFFVAGFDTISATLTAALYYLSKHEEIQERLFEEIENLDQVNSESLADLDYLQAFLTETLRMFPPFVHHERVCMKDTQIDGIPIRKGTRIQMPIYSAHMNPKFFPEPMKFNPNRFLKDNAKNIIPLTWRPFGGGNRICIGIRFAMNEMKIALGHILKEYKIESTEKTKLNILKGDIFMYTISELYVKFTPRN